VLAPCAGRVLPITETPDPVFAGEMVGPGVVIDPDPHEATVTAPIDGRVLKVHPHAFVVLGTDGVGVLVHLGINTVRLEGNGFEVLAQEGSTVHAGDPMVRWNPATIGDTATDADISTMVPVVAMDRPKGSVRPPAAGTSVSAGDLLFEVTA
jgi:glucose-specific phosphotransferase system IIA component